MSSLPIDFANTRISAEPAVHARQGLEPWVLLAPLGLALLGVLLLYSATTAHETGTALLDTPPVRHAAFTVVGLGAMLLVARVDYRLLASLAPAIYVGTLGLLVLVMLVGESMSG